MTSGEGKRRFLVGHTYVTAGLCWWIRARSAVDILETFAEAVVVEDKDRVAKAAGWNLAEIDIDSAIMPALLERMRARRVAQRDEVGFGALASAGTVYLKRRRLGDDGVRAVDYLIEVGSDGRRIRQVERGDDGPSVRMSLHDRPFNPPMDMYDPRLVGQRIGKDEFEAAWVAALPAPT